MPETLEKPRDIKVEFPGSDNEGPVDVEVSEHDDDGLTDEERDEVLNLSRTPEQGEADEAARDQILSGELGGVALKNPF